MPSNCSFSSDALLIRIKEEVRRLQRRHQVKTSSPTGGVAGANAVSSEGSDDETETRANQPHLLTLKQVNLICARLLKEREEKIREEYDQILFEKLNGEFHRLDHRPLIVFSFFLEQHENFVRFTQDQLTRRFSELQFSCKLSKVNETDSPVFSISDVS